MTYKATTIPSGVTQVNCGTAANNVECYTISYLVDSIIKRSVIYQIYMTGGNSFYYYVDVDVICPKAVGVTQTSPLRTLNYVQSASDSRSYSLALISLVTACPVKTYILASSTPAGVTQANCAVA